MFKPSLKKSVLQDKLILPSSEKSPSSFSNHKEPSRKCLLLPKQNLVSHPINQQNFPSMLLPQELLQKKSFRNKGNSTHIFTPLSYDFKAYPTEVREMVKRNQEGTKVGRIKETLINYAYSQQRLILWQDVTPISNRVVCTHNMPYKISLVSGAPICNPLIFKYAKVVVLAICFKSKVALFQVNTDSLKLEDLMLRYHLKSCQHIQKVVFTEKNEIIISGDSGQISMVSFNSEKGEQVIPVISPFLKKYCSPESFDYFTEHNIRDIVVGQKFLYCLHDKISRQNFILFKIKSLVNKVVKLNRRPEQITKETFIDVYKLVNDRQSITFIDRLKENAIIEKLTQNYQNLSEEGVPDGLSIVAISLSLNIAEDFSKKGKSPLKPSLKEQIQISDSKIEEEDSKSQSSEEKSMSESNIENSEISEDAFSVLTVRTKCGYKINFRHKSSKPLKPEQSNFSFLSTPERIAGKVGEACLFEPKTFIDSYEKQQFRINYVQGSLGNGNLQVMSDRLIYESEQQDLNRQLCMVKCQKIRKQTAMQNVRHKEYFCLTDQKFTQSYGLKYINPASEIQNYSFFNFQRNWTVFSDQGVSTVYHLKLRHIILCYLHYKCHCSKQADPSNESSLSMSFDLKFQATIEKMVHTYGYCAFAKALLEILTLNQSQKRQYFYVQKEFIDQILRREYGFDFGTQFEEWNYTLDSQHQAFKIIPSIQMLREVWALLLKYQYQPILKTEVVKTASFHHYSGQYLENFSLFLEKQKNTYSCFGYALQSLFYEIIEDTLHFRARDYKLKYKLLKEAQEKLGSLASVLSQKEKKENSPEFNNYLTSRIQQMNDYKKENSSREFSNKFSILNTTQSTAAHNSFDESQLSESLPNGMPETDPSRSRNHQSVTFLENVLKASIQKIITLISVMSVLVEKDERDGLPNFFETLTSIKNQKVIGREFFEQELFRPRTEQDFQLLNPKGVTFVHENLVDEAKAYLPELQLHRKIEYQKFKNMRNLHTNRAFEVEELNSLDLVRLSKIIDTYSLPQIRQYVLNRSHGSTINVFQERRYSCYFQLITLWTARIYLELTSLQEFSNKQYESLMKEAYSHRMKYGPSESFSSTMNISPHSIILAKQKSEFYSDELFHLQNQLKAVFTEVLEHTTKAKGSEFFETEELLKFMISSLIGNFSQERVLMQFVEQELRRVNFLDKVAFMQRNLEGTVKENSPKILKVDRTKDSSKIMENSTFDTLRGFDGTE